MIKYKNSIFPAIIFPAIFMCVLVTFVFHRQAKSESIQPQYKQIPQQKISPLPQKKIEPTPKQVPGTTTSKPPLPPPASLPDLQINRVFLSKPYQNTPLPGYPVIGDKVDLCCEYANTGKDMPGSSWTLMWKYAFYVDGANIITYDAGALSAGESHIACVPYTLNKEGAHQLDCVLDTTNKISEANENNNKKTINFNVGVTDAPPVYGPGVNLRVTDLLIDNNDGRVAAIVRNSGPSAMSFDAKIRLRRDNVLIKECVWPKTVNKMTCAANGLERNAPGADPNICNWGKGDYEIHAEIITEPAQPEVDKTGRNKKGMLRARQDLYASRFCFDPLKRIGIVVGNKGPCYATPWSYKFYIDGKLIETRGPFGGLIHQNKYSCNMLVNQPVLTEKMKHSSRFKFEIIPQYPDYEQNTNNNVHEEYGLAIRENDLNIAVTDIKFFGETYFGSGSSAYSDAYYHVIPYIANTTTSYNGNWESGYINMVIYIDNVPTWFNNANLCHIDAGVEDDYLRSCNYLNPGNFPILPVGSHTVKVVIYTNDSSLHDNYLTKTMVRP